jgi:hypothetical protein
MSETSTDNFESLIQKLVEVEKKASSEKGKFALFALLARPEAPEHMELVVSAPWIEGNVKEAFEYLAKEMKAILSSEEMLLISRIVSLDSDNPYLTKIQRNYIFEHVRNDVLLNHLDGHLTHGTIITSQRLVKPSVPASPSAR